MGLSTRASSAYGTQLAGRYDMRPLVGARYWDCMTAIPHERLSVSYDSMFVERKWQAVDVKFTELDYEVRFTYLTYAESF